MPREPKPPPALMPTGQNTLNEGRTSPVEHEDTTTMIDVNGRHPFPPLQMRLPLSSPEQHITEYAQLRPPDRYRDGAHPQQRHLTHPKASKCIFPVPAPDPRADQDLRPNPIPRALPQVRRRRANADRAETRLDAAAWSSLQIHSCHCRHVCMSSPQARTLLRFDSTIANTTFIQPTPRPPAPSTLSDAPVSRH
ncbi:hypothetical protein B0H16DRAFT_1723651 [Mycena metata]|uniref:Uncharacterized protein n=1 Tax=Mycena metata TaxID=1033252 RepID=A0AAD7J078_9AGAR|nr:hypothetical protein B0H16DRAFT_1723651 [Mycena metata]